MACLLRLKELLSAAVEKIGEGHNGAKAALNAVGKVLCEELEDPPTAKAAAAAAPKKEVRLAASCSLLAACCLLLAACWWSTCSR